MMIDHDDVAASNEDTKDSLKKLTAIYIKIRDARTILKREFDAADSDLKEQMETISNELMDYCDRNGVESAKTDAGTFYRSVRTRYWAADKEAFNKFVLDSGLVDLLENRVSQKNVKTFLEENPETPIPGLMSDSTYTLGVRKPTK